MRRVALLIVLVAFTFSCGGQWYVLQGIAWANMIREYSQMVPLTQAVEMTFSGEYPCELCKIICEKKQSNNLKALAWEKQEKKSPVSLKSTILVSSPASCSFLPAGENFFWFRSEIPPTPPPRLS